jgi:hypothetical protein
LVHCGPAHALLQRDHTCLSAIAAIIGWKGFQFITYHFPFFKIHLFSIVLPVGGGRLDIKAELESDDQAKLPQKMEKKHDTQTTKPP